jgi:hypothetical protein
MINTIKAWILARWAERTSWNGVWIIGLGIAILVLPAFIKTLGYAAIVYGAWQIWKKESE